MEDTLTIAEYLQVLDNYTFTDNTLTRILVKCNNLYGYTIAGLETTVGEFTAEQLDLCEAWTWVYASGIVSMSNGGKKSVGNRSVAYATFNPAVSDRKAWMERANELFKKHDKPEVFDGDTAQIEDMSLLWNNGRPEFLS